MDSYDAVVVGGGPAGATAAHELALRGRSVLLLDRDGRVKPCGGAVPPQLLVDFDVPESMLVNRVRTARVIAPAGERVDIPVEDGFVGMVDRGPFDEWLRCRAVEAGADRRVGTYKRITRDGGPGALVHFADGETRNAPETTVRARYVVGADGALSAVARQEVPGSDEARYVFAYHEIIESPGDGAGGAGAAAAGTGAATENGRGGAATDGAGAGRGTGNAFGARRCDVYYSSEYSPDFYAWVFPHGPTTSVGMGTMEKGYGMRESVARLRARTGLDRMETLKQEGAPIPLKPLPRWENGRDVILAGDAAGVVAPASGEGIFYAMTGGRLAAEAVDAALEEGAGALAQARRRFLKAHGQVFMALGIMQRFWYSSDRRRESFVAICRDRDVQRLTFEGYMRKELVKAKPLAHLRIFLKNIGHLTGVLRGRWQDADSGLDRAAVEAEDRDPAEPAEAA